MKKHLRIIVAIMVISVVISCEKPTDSDNEPPTVAITYPANNSEFVQGTVINITAEATDNEEVDKVDFYIDNSNIFTDTSSPYQYEWDTAGLLGNHTIYAKAFDTNDNQSNSNTITVTIIEEPDTLKLIIEPSSQTIETSSNALFSVVIEDAVDLFAFSGKIEFDGSLVEYQDADKGSFWSGYESMIEIIEDPGCTHICVGLLQTSLEDGIDGNGVLFELELKGIAEGQSSISFSNIQLFDEDANLIENFNSIVYDEGELLIE